jgi:filamentous hemagglutinin family protein
MAASIASRLALLTSPGSLVVGLALVLAATLPLPAQAQITPDATLGDEASRMTPETLVQGDLADLIEGGAIRGGNLFHSFLEFNVDLGQRVYFANPVGIESILSRVTGGDPSSIFGTLGVDGAAALFLINPNGIVFGENASLDIQGSFYATTAAAIPLGEGVYSATAPEQSSLLTVDPSALFSSYLSDASGDIENRGQLAAQGNMTLAGNNLDLQGQVAAGGDLTLLGNTVQIRDAVDTPFVGFAGGDLLVQGNGGVDIVALSHADSGLYSYGDMVLRSANPVGGDAHYWSGGSFRVENLDGSLGELFSPIDPVIRALGDVALFGYQGGSLHILAGGSVNIRTAIITDADPGELGVDFLRETITLSDGTVVAIDGGAQPTLDVRAGVAPEAIGLIPLENPSGVNPFTDFFFDDQFQPSAPGIGAVPSRADITVGDVLMAAPNGLVLLTTQYQPNANLAGGSIFITGAGLGGVGIDARGFADFGGQGGAVYLDARNDMSVTNSTIQTSGAGVVGDVVINAGNTVRFDQQNRLTGVASDLAAGTEGTGGSIQITATNVEVLNGAQLRTSTRGIGNAGNITISVEGNVLLEGVNPTNGDFSGLISRVERGATGNSGDIYLSASNLDIRNGAIITTSTSGIGDAGDIIINARDTINLTGINPFDGRISNGIDSSVQRFGLGSGGNINITTNNLRATNGAQITSGTSGGDGGDVLINADGDVSFSGANQRTGLPSGISNNTFSSSYGDGGDIVVRASTVEVVNGASLQALTTGNGNAGNITLESGAIRISGIGSLTGLPSTLDTRAEVLSTGFGGSIRILANSLNISDGAEVTASTLGSGNAGSISIVSQDSTQVNNATIRTDAQRSSGGQINIHSRNVLFRNDSDIQTFVTSGQGGGGNITITGDFVIALEDSDILAFSADGQGGDIDLSRTTFFGQNANIASGQLSREELLALDGNDRVDVNASGGVEPGQITVGDSSFIENSLTNLEDVVIDTAALTAGSCIARTDESLGSFTVTGSGGLPQRPGDSAISAYPTGTVQTLATPAATHTLLEPDGVYQLPDGRLVLSRACE